MSVLAKVSTAILVAACFILAVVAVRAEGLSARDDISWFHWGDWLNAPPVAILAFQAHIQTVPILFELKDGAKSAHSKIPNNANRWSLREIRMAIFVLVAGIIWRRRRDLSWELSWWSPTQSTNFVHSRQY